MMNKYLPPCLGIFGLIFLILGVVFTAYVIPLMEQRFAQEIRANDSVGYNEFVEPSRFVKKLKVHFFEVINGEDVMEKYEKPIVQDTGPYVYDVKTTRTVKNLDFDRKTIEFFETNHYAFNTKESKNYGENDTVTILNVFLKGMETKLRDDTMLPRVFTDTLKSDTEIFKATQVDDFLFNGITIDCDEINDMYCEFLRIDSPKYVRISVDEEMKFSLFGHMNDSTKGPFQIYFGKENSTTGTVLSFKEKRKWKEWGPEGECRVLKGFKVLFPALGSAEPQINVFLEDLCRSMYFVFGDYTNIMGVPTYTYISAEGPLDNTEENTCFCKGNKLDSCDARGTMNLERCTNFPLIVSYPHFYLGDPTLQEFVQGLNPTKKLHQSFISIEPKSGTQISAAMRFQLNLKLDINKGENSSEPSRGIFPILWTEEVIEPTKELIEKFQNNIYYMKLLRVLMYILIFLGILMIGFLVCHIIYLKNK